MLVRMLVIFPLTDSVYVGAWYTNFWKHFIMLVRMYKFQVVGGVVMEVRGCGDGEMEVEVNTRGRVSMGMLIYFLYLKMTYLL